MNHDHEPQAAARVGQLVFSFARLDFLLALALRKLLAARSSEDLNPLIERLGFKEKIDALREVISSKRPERPSAAAEYEAWYVKADKLRATRNAFVHGRWGVQSQETVFNASPKFGKAISGSSKHFSLAELDAEVSTAREVLESFYEWHSRHVISAAYPSINRTCPGKPGHAGYLKRSATVCEVTMRQLRITEAFAKYGAKLQNQRWSYSAFAEDNSLVLCCWQRYLTKNPGGSYRYEVNDFTKWTSNSLGKALLVDHLKRAKAGKLVVRMILVTTTPVKAVVAGVDGSKIKKTFQVLDNLAGYVVEMT